MPLALRVAVAFFAAVTGCASTPKLGSAPEPADPLEAAAPAEATSRSAPPAAARERCIVVQMEGETPAATVEGRLAQASGSADGLRGQPLMLLRLSRARCVVGLARASYLTEVYVASTGADLRPLLGQAVRISGSALGGVNDLGGPAVVILANDVERLALPDAPP